MRALPLIVLLAMTGTACARDIYVDPLHGSNTTGTGAEDRPFQGIWQAGAVAQPCDTVHVLATAPLLSQSIGNVHGTATCPITFTGRNAGFTALTELGQLDPSADRASLILYSDTYLAVTGFHVVGSQSGPGGGIALSSLDQQHVSHHVIIDGNLVEGVGGGGILAFESDYVTIRRNIVWGTSHFTKFARGSGISVTAAYDIDASTAAKVIIDSNEVYGNTNTPYCPDAGTREACLAHADSDGSGIIADANSIKWVYPQGVSPSVQAPPYHGRIVISNNLSMGNGGRGIHVFRSSHADVWNNTLLMNNRDPYNQYVYPGELNITESTDDTVNNNLLYSVGGLGFQSTPRVCAYFGPWVGTSDYDGTDPIRRPVTMNRNWCFQANHITGSPVFWAYPGLAQAVVGTVLTGEPHLRHAVPDASGDLRPLPGSPLLDASNTALGRPLTDYAGALRGRETAIGAYDNTSN